jgi:tryptophan-rich sensory protein
MRSAVVFLAFLVAVVATASLGAFFAGPGVRNWYPLLTKPSWTPPGWIFGPVWTTLYLCIAVAGFLAWRQSRFMDASWAIWFALQLSLNAGWSWIFFGLRQPGWAFAEIVVLWGSILVTTLSLFRVSREAGWLFIPYLLWVTFAAALNFSIWRLNGAHVRG